MKTLIVTAFFDIGRDKATVKGMNRSNEKYFTYFKFWSRLNNDLVVYTQPCFMEKVASIRSEYGRKEKTIIIPIEDITEIEPDIYNKMCKIEKCNEWSKMRLNIDAMSNQAKYNYVMFLKYWCMNDALKRARGGMTKLYGWILDLIMEENIIQIRQILIFIGIQNLNMESIFLY